MIIFEFDDSLGIATVDFDGCYYYPTAKLHPTIEKWIKDNCVAKCSIVCHINYDYMIFGYPCPYEEVTLFTIFFEDEMDAIKFKLFWL